MLKTMATELLRDTLDLLPQRVSSDCGGNRKKASLDAKTEKRNGRETSKVARGGAGNEYLNSRTTSNYFDQDDTRRT